MKIVPASFLMKDPLSPPLLKGGRGIIRWYEKPFQRRSRMAKGEDIEQKESLFGELLEKITGIVGGSGERDQKLASICRLLKMEVAYYDWVGFYIADAQQSELVLGPFAGEKTEHVRIPFGKGICGQAIQKGETFVVQDVSKESNYLACSPRVKSEMVVPIFVRGECMAELDIDSHTPSPFTQEDRKFLEKVCQVISSLFDEGGKHDVD